MEVEKYWQKIEEYFTACYEKREYMIPNNIFGLLGIIGIALVVLGYVVFGLFALLISAYFTSYRYGRKKGFLDGFDERKNLEESALENVTSLEEEMNSTIEYFKNKK